MDQVAPTFFIPKWGIYSISRWGIYFIVGGGMGGGRIYTTPFHLLCIFLCPCPNKFRKEQQMWHIRVWHANHRNMILWGMRPLGVLLPKELVPQQL
jgi:hypothetical protein